MRQAHRLLAVLYVFAALLFLLGIPSFARGTESSRFPNGVIVVPQGTEIAIDDDKGTVAITDCPVTISEGDTFIIYLQDLPIGYVANSVSMEDCRTVIEAEKADKSVYMGLEEEGVVYLTGDMYEFIPAETVANASTAFQITDAIKYKDGDLSVTVGFADGANIKVKLSGLSLAHSFADGNISVTLSGSWSITTEMEFDKDCPGQVPLGELRVWGVGKIALYIDVEMKVAMATTFSGSFTTGFVSTGDSAGGTLIKNFSVTEKKVEGKGNISISLKITAGIDILVAEADVYAEIGITSQIKTQTVTHYDRDPIETVHCDDIKFYIFSKVGAEAKYRTLSGSMKKIASADMDIMDENSSPYLLDVHFENGQLVSACSEGMNTSSIDMSFGSKASGFSSDLLSTSRDRVMETAVSLPWDLVVEEDYTIAHGDLDLNGHTLEVYGNLIHAGGTLNVGSGKLIVHGDYRQQLNDSGTYLSSPGRLSMTNSDGSLIIDGDMIIQSEEANVLSAGTIILKGNLWQKDSYTQASNFTTSEGLLLRLTADRTHTISFESPENNKIGYLCFDNDVVALSGMRVGILDGNAHNLTVHGSLTATGSVEMNDASIEAAVVDMDAIVLTSNYSVMSIPRFHDLDLGGYTLTVDGDMISAGTVDLHGGELNIIGNLYQESGTIYIHEGTMRVHGDYYIVSSSSSFEPGNIHYDRCSASLKMIFDADEVRVDGSLLTCGNSCEMTRGTLYLAGDFTEMSGGTFSASGDHQFVFNGSGSQTIRFENTGNGFASVNFENPNIVFASGIRGFELNDDIMLQITAEPFGINGTWKLNGHSIGGEEVFVPDPFVFRSGEIDLGGSRVQIRNLHQVGGNLFINHGELDISGNYDMSGIPVVNKDESIIIPSGSGTLEMLMADDVVRVEGDLIAYGGSHSGKLTAGTLFISGNLIQKTGNSSSFCATGEHLVSFNGSRRQKICFDSPGSSHFAHVHFENSDIEFASALNGNVAQTGTVHPVITAEDFSFSGAWTLSPGSALLLDCTDDQFVLPFDNVAILVDGGSLIIPGTATQNGGSVTLKNGGSMEIQGNYTQTNATMNIDGGILEIAGNYQVGYNALLAMTDEEGIVRVKGDFVMHSPYDHGDKLTAGTLYVAGNFTQQSMSNYSGFRGDNFDAGNTHLVVLNGTGTQTVHFDNHRTSGFANIRFDCPAVVFDTPVRGFALSADLRIPLDGGNLTFGEGTVDLNGHTLTIDGNLEQTYCTMNIGSGTLDIAGNYQVGYNAFLAMTDDEGIVRVKGDFVMHSPYDHGDKLTAGTMYVAGNFTQKYISGNNDSSYNFYASNTHKVVLDGIGVRSVKFEGSGSHFAILQLTQPLSLYTISPTPCWTTLIATDTFLFHEPDFRLPGMLDRIEPSAFEGIKATVVYVPDSCTSIGNYAFRDSAVKQIRIPAGCEMGADVFAGCEEVYVFGTSGSPAEAYCAKHDECTFIVE